MGTELQRNLIILAAIGEILTELGVDEGDVLSADQLARMSAYADSRPVATEEDHVVNVELAKQIFRELTDLVIAEVAAQ